VKDRKNEREVEGHADSIYLHKYSETKRKSNSGKNNYNYKEHTYCRSTSN
jgi:hypothetical protein